MSLTRVATAGGFFVQSPLVSTEDTEPIVSLQGGGGAVLDVTATAPIVSSGGTAPNISVTPATSSALGVVRPDNTTITVNVAGVISTASVSAVTAVTGTAPIVSSGGLTPAISVTPATAAALGVVRPDNTTISVASGVISAVGAVTAVTGTAPIVSTGGTTPAVSVNQATNASHGVVRPDNTTITISGGILTAVIPPAVTAVSGTAPIVSSGGLTPAISVTAATTSVLGVVKPDNATLTVDGSGNLKLLALTVGVSLIGQPTVAQTVALLAMPAAGQFAANFAGSFGSVGTNPTGAAVYTVKKGASTIGTVSISTSGVFTFATTGGLAQTFAQNDRLTITAPSPADATLADVAFGLTGTRT